LKNISSSSIRLPNALLAKRHWLAWVFLLGGLLLAAAVYYQAQALVAQEIRARIDARAGEAAFSVQHQIGAYTEVLRGLQAQFAAQRDLSADGFRRATVALDLERRLPGIQAIGFSPVGEDGRFAVRYIEPEARNQRGIGYAQFGEPARRAAIERARDGGDIANTGRVRLFIEPGDIDGVVFFLPVYRDGAVPSTPEMRRAAIAGVVFLAIRVDEMLRDVFGPDLLEELSIAIYETDGTTGHRVPVYRSAAARAPEDGPVAGMGRTLVLPLNGSDWELQASASPAALGGVRPWLPPLAAAGSMLLTLMVFFVIRVLDRAQRRSDIRAQAAEHSLADREMQLAEITRAIDAVLWTIALPEHAVRYVSPAVSRIFGHPAQAFYDHPQLWLECIHAEDRAGVVEEMDALAAGRRTVLEHRIVRPDGEVRWLRFEANALSGRIDAICTDVTRPREMAQSLRRTNRALRAIHECEARIAAADDERLLLQGICDVAVTAGYAMAWAGLLAGGDDDVVEPVAVAGSHQDYVATLEGSLAAGWQGMATIAQALRTRQPVVANDFRSDSRLARWRDDALRCGFNSKVALPLAAGETMLGVLNVYASETAAFDPEELDLLCRMARRVAAALLALRQHSRHRLAEHELRLRERAIEASANAIIITAADRPGHPVQYVNPAFERMTGYRADEIVGRSLGILHRDDHDQPGLTEIRNILQERRVGHATMRNYRKDGTLFWSDVYIAPVRDEQGAVTHFVAAKYDITETKRYEAELEFHASHDTLTGLANRQLLQDRLKQAIAYASRYGESLWVVFVNLDHFKLINEGFGHTLGDRMLKLIAMRLAAAVRETDTVARHGGDEFVLILPEHKGDRPRAGIVQRVMETIVQPLAIDGHEFRIGCSVGIAAYPIDGESAETLIQHAHIAMYRAKECGRNQSQFYTEDMNQSASERLQLENDLRNALERHEFLLHYQPQIALDTGAIAGAEALVRWRHPALGMVSPARFIPLAEETGLIVPLGRWILQTACRQMVAWQAAGLACPRVAVNLSARQFADRELVEFITETLRETGLAPHLLEVELTESLVMQDVDHTIHILGELKALGVHIAVDDFGTGYSSLAYLKRFPIDVLKIDQSFVRDIDGDAGDAVIVDTIISLAHSLHLQVIAEGVETEAQMRYLRARGCEQGQGYLFSRPLPAEGMGTFLRETDGMPGRDPAQEGALS
jgi:diguanylate cyclase (GGDEF)-like protein/PAS domain S-box-containing protein